MPPQKHPNPDLEQRIARVALLTKQMRKHQASIDAAARERDALVHDLLHAGVPQSVIAKRADVTTHALTKSLRHQRRLPSMSAS